MMQVWIRNWTNLDLDGKTIESWCAFMQNMFSPISLVDFCLLIA